MSAAETRPEDLRIDMGSMMGAVLSRWLRILLVTAVALGATFAVLLFVPRMYESSAGLLVEQRTSALTGAPSAQSSQASIPVEAMMASQIELIKSRDTLLSVIDGENLRSESELTGVGFSPVALVMQLIGRRPEPRSIDEAVLQNLNDRLTVMRERDSAVISINVRSASPELAARIANAIADAHVKRRTGLSLSDTAEASQWLEQEIEKLRVKVREAETAVADYRVDNDLFAGTNNTSILDQQLSNVATQITAAQERKNAAQSRANLIRGLLDAGRPLDGVQDVRNSVAIQQLSQSKANLQGELAQRSSTLLPNHPTVRALVAQIDEIETQIAREARRVADALDAEARIEGDLEASLRDDMVRMKLSVSTATRDTVTLEGLQREAKAQRDLLESYLLRYSEAISRTGSGSALPDVRVVTEAAPAVQPASPKTALILGAVGFVALALQIGGVLFGELMSGRALTGRYAFRQVQEGDTGEDYEQEPPAAGYFDEPEATDELLPEPQAEEYEPAPPDLDWLESPTSDLPDPQSDEPSAAAGLAALVAPIGTAQNRQLGENALELGNLSADIAIGRVRVVMLAAIASNSDCELVAQSLVADALRRGLSVVRIDAGSGRPSVEPGLTDLSADRASFGDVVHRISEGLAEVPWGHQPALERRSMRPSTLVEALTDIYEVVIVVTGRIGMTSALPVFAGLDCRLVLVGGATPDPRQVEAAIEDATSLGYDVGQVVHPVQLQTEVA